MKKYQDLYYVDFATGGTFKVGDYIATVAAPDYASVYEETSGKVIKDGNIPLKDANYIVGDKNFISLNSALTYANTTSNSIKLSKDITTSGYLDINDDFDYTLDLNGHNISTTIGIQG